MHLFRLRALFACILCLGGVQAVAGERFALIVGANDGGRARPELRYAARDAASLSDVLVKLGQVSPATIKTLQQPSKQELLDSLETIAQTLATKSQDGELIFYYSGHADEKGLLLGHERLPYELIKAKVKNLPARLKLLIIDACFSGSLTFAKGGSSARPFLSSTPQETKGFAIMTSSSMDEASQESERLRSSFFTHYLLAGLRGAADANSDRQVTLSEAYRYAYQETLQATAKTQLGAQHPSYDFQLNGRGEVVLTDLRRLLSSVEFPAGLEGDYYIRSEQGHLFLELHKKPGTSEILALEPGSYEIVRYAGSQYLHGFFEIKEKQKIAVGQIQLTAIAAEKVAARGDFEFPEFYSKKSFKISLWPERQVWGQQGTEKQQATFHISPLIGSVGSLRGLGLGLFGHTSHEARGIVASLGFTYNQGKIIGLQLSPGINITEELTGLQFGFFNSSYIMDQGAQIGIINRGGLISGWQLGLLNMAESSEGLQFGIINYAERSRGLSIAPIMIIKNGIIYADVWGDQLGFAHLALRSGTPYYYSTFYVASNGTTNMVGLGPGLRWPIDDSAFCLDLSWGVYQTTSYTFRISDGALVKDKAEKVLLTLRRLRVFYEWPLTDSWKAIVGLSETLEAFGGADQVRSKSLGRLRTGKVHESDHDRKQRGVMLGVSYSLLESYR